MYMTLKNLKWKIICMLKEGYQIIFLIRQCSPKRVLPKSLANAQDAHSGLPQNFRSVNDGLLMEYFRQMVEYDTSQIMEYLMLNLFAFIHICDKSAWNFRVHSHLRQKYMHNLFVKSEISKMIKSVWCISNNKECNLT